MQPVLQLIARVGPSDANVLITGDARHRQEVVGETLHAISPPALHEADGYPSTRADSRKAVFESELFGHVKGAFHRCQDGPRRPLRNWRDTGTLCPGRNRKRCR